MKYECRDHRYGSCDKACGNAFGPGLQTPGAIEQQRDEASIGDCVGQPAEKGATLSPTAPKSATHGFAMLKAGPGKENHQKSRQGYHRNHHRSLNDGSAVVGEAHHSEEHRRTAQNGRRTEMIFDDGARGCSDNRQYEDHRGNDHNLVEKRRTAQQDPEKSVVLVGAKDPGEFKRRSKKDAVPHNDRGHGNEATGRAESTHVLDDLPPATVGAPEYHRQKYG